MAIDNEQVKALADKFGEKMEKTVSVLKGDYNALRVGRANPHVLDKVNMDYYGQPSPIAQCGNVTVTDARCITISLWDASLLKACEKAILEANIGLTPTNDGKVIRLVFPELTEERRKDIAKQVKKMAEDAKVALRNERRDTFDAMKKLKTDKVITEDQYASYEKELEKVFSGKTEEVERLAKEKEKDVMSV